MAGLGAASRGLARRVWAVHGGERLGKARIQKEVFIDLFLIQVY